MVGDPWKCRYMASITQEVVVLNDFGFEERRRTTSSGTTNRYTVTIKAEPVVHVFDPRALGRGVAEAMAAAIRSGIRDIAEIASPSTRRRRDAAAEALRRGAAWAVARYDGGKTGRKDPGKTPRLFNDSGRLAEGIVAGPNDDGWVINVTANRFDPTTFVGGVPALVSMYERLRALVPVLQGPERLMQDEGVKAAITDSLYQLIVVKGGALTLRKNQLMSELRKMKLDLVKQIAGGLAGL